MSTMHMPDDVYATLAAVVARYPHIGTDDERRIAMGKAVATIRARHGRWWVWKTEHASLIAPSKDGLGCVVDGEPIEHGRLTRMFIFDTINGGTRQPHAPPLVSEEPRPAYVLAVEPRDWLAGEVPAPTPTPAPGDGGHDSDADPLQDTAIAALLDNQRQIVTALEGLERRLAAVETTVRNLKAKGRIDLPIVIRSFTNPRVQGDVELEVTG